MKPSMARMSNGNKKNESKVGSDGPQAMPTKPRNMDANAGKTGMAGKTSIGSQVTSSNWPHSNLGEYLHKKKKK